MARKKLIAGNWKMNCLSAEGVALAKAVAEKVKANKFEWNYFQSFTKGRERQNKFYFVFE